MTTVYQVLWGFSNGGQMFTDKNRARRWAISLNELPPKREQGSKFTIVPIEIEDERVKECLDVWHEHVRNM